MRYFQLVLSPESGAFHRLDGLVAEHPDLERVAILHIKLLNDDTGVALYLLDGDPGDFEAVLSGEPETLSYDVFESENEGFYAHVHFRPDDPATELLRVADRYRLVIDPPLEFTADGNLRLTAAGPQELVRRAAADLPESVDAYLEVIGEYDPEHESLVSVLTDRQREVLRTAVEMGYYDIPRNVTHDDLANELDLSAGTVGEHLRKIEANILSQLVT